MRCMLCCASFGCKVMEKGGDEEKKEGKVTLRRPKAPSNRNRKHKQQYLDKLITVNDIDLLYMNWITLIC